MYVGSNLQSEDISINKERLNMRSAFLISKPLQYFNSKNIPSEKFEKKDCFLVNNFFDAPEFAGYIKKIKYWNKVMLFPNDFAAIIYFIVNSRKYDNLYLYSDISTIITILLFFVKRKNISTYEEGFGSYRYFPYRSNGVFFNKIRKIFKVTNWMGGNGLTKTIFVYHPTVLNRLVPESKAKKVKKLTSSFYESAINSLESKYFFNEIDFALLKNKKIFLLLGSWNINSNYKKILNDFQNYTTILKPHPHFRSSLESYDFDFIIKKMPAELLIVNLIKICSKVVVVHENSTTIIYLPLSTHDHIHEINISNNEKSKNIYENIKKNILLDL